MRKTVSPQEVAKAQAIVESWHNAEILFEEDETNPECLGVGCYNAVFALTKDLVVRMSRRRSFDCGGHDVADNSWDAYKLSQMHPELGLVKVWHSGVVELKGDVRDSYRAWAIVERCETTALQAVNRGRVSSLEVDAFSKGASAKFVAAGYDVHDLHLCNICLSRGKRPRLVITDCHISPV